MKVSPCTIDKVEIGGQTIMLEGETQRSKKSLTNSFPQGSFDFHKIYK